jgi:hypothetical protein
MTQAKAMTQATTETLTSAEMLETVLAPTPREKPVRTAKILEKVQKRSENHPSLSNRLHSSV